MGYSFLSLIFAELLIQNIGPTQIALSVRISDWRQYFFDIIKIEIIAYLCCLALFYFGLQVLDKVSPSKNGSKLSLAVNLLLALGVGIANSILGMLFWELVS